MRTDRFVSPDNERVDEDFLIYRFKTYGKCDHFYGGNRIGRARVDVCVDLDERARLTFSLNVKYTLGVLTQAF